MHDPTFRYRVTAGLIFFLCLAVYDVYRHGRHSRRIREYAFLAGFTLAAMAYGVLHDYITWSISPDYFSRGKGIASAADGYSMEVMLLAVKAFWSAGLISGAVLLVANTPGKAGCRLTWDRLLYIALWIPALSICFESIAGILVFSGYHSLCGLMEGLVYTEMRRNFFTVWAMHAGAYTGGAAGLIWAVHIIRRRKKQMAAEHIHE